MVVPGDLAGRHGAWQQAVIFFKKKPLPLLVMVVRVCFFKKNAPDCHCE
jgi:hypothetical protein